MIIDTDIFIDYLKGVERSIAFLERVETETGELVTTTVNVAELWRGACLAPREAHREAARDVINRVKQIPFGPKAALRYGDLTAALDRAGTPLAVPDALIAAITLEHGGGRLVTRNVRDFRRVPNLELINP